MGYYKWERKPNTHELGGMGDRIDPQRRKNFRKDAEQLEAVL
jgi:hypothetical protein